MDVSFSLSFLATATLFLACAAQSPSPSPSAAVNPFCTTSDYKQLCTKMVHGATSLDEATFSAIKSTLNVIYRALPMLSAIAPAAESQFGQALTRNSTVDTCRKSFDSVVSNLEGALENLKAGDKYGVNDKLSATSLADCTDAFAEFRGVSPLASLAFGLKRYVSNCLAVSQQI